MTKSEIGNENTELIEYILIALDESNYDIVDDVIDMSKTNYAHVITIEDFKRVWYALHTLNEFETTKLASGEICVTMFENVSSVYIILTLSRNIYTPLNETYRKCLLNMYTIHYSMLTK